MSEADRAAEHGLMMPAREQALSPALLDACEIANDGVDARLDGFSISAAAHFPERVTPDRHLALAVRGYTAAIDNRIHALAWKHAAIPRREARQIGWNLT